MGDFASQFLQGFMIGHQIRSQRERLAREDQDRKMQMEEFELGKKRVKLEGAKAARKAQLEEAMMFGPQYATESPMGTPLPDAEMARKTPLGNLPFNPGAGMEQEQPVNLPAVGAAPEFGEPGVPERRVMVSDIMQQLARQRMQTAMSSPGVLSKRLEIESQNAPVTIPSGAPGAGATVPRFLAGPTVTAAGRGAQQQSQQTFAAGQNQLNRDAAAKRAEEANRTRLQAAGIAAAARGASGGAGDPEGAAAWVDSVSSGQAQISNVPIGIRTAVIKGMAEKGVLAVNDKIRGQLDQLDAAKKILDQIESLVNRLIAKPTDLEAALLLRGLRQSSASMFAKGVFREAGMLTNQDIGRAQALIPGIIGTEILPNISKARLQQLRDLIKASEDAYVENHYRVFPRPGASSPTGIPAVGEQFQGKRVISVEKVK